MPAAGAGGCARAQTLANYPGRRIKHGGGARRAAMPAAGVGVFEREQTLANHPGWRSRRGASLRRPDGRQAGRPAVCSEFCLGARILRVVSRKNQNSWDTACASTWRNRKANVW
jgi:hypothetical protein